MEPWRRRNIVKGFHALLAASPRRPQRASDLVADRISKGGDAPAIRRPLRQRARSAEAEQTGPVLRRRSAVGYADFTEEAPSAPRVGCVLNEISLCGETREMRPRTLGEHGGRGALKQEIARGFPIEPGRSAVKGFDPPEASKAKRFGGERGEFHSCNPSPGKAMSKKYGRQQPADLKTSSRGQLQP